MLLRQLVLLLLFAGCDRSTPEQRAEAAVRDFWAAVEAGDCGRLIPIVTKPMTPDGCQEWVAELKQNGVRFVDVESVAPDGRAPEVMIARVRVSDGAKERVVLVRASPAEGGFKVSL